MRPYKLPATGVLITVTDVSTSPLSLIETAVGSSIDFPDDLNWIKLHPKDGAILSLLDGNDADNTTTPQTGFETFQNDKDTFKGMPINNMRIQRKKITVPADVKVVVQIGWTDAHGN